MTDRVSDARLDELEALTAALRPAPWESLIEGRDFPEGGSSFVRLYDETGEQNDLYLSLDPHEWDDAVALHDWIAAARNDMTALIAEIKAQRQTARP